MPVLTRCLNSFHVRSNSYGHNQTHARRIDSAGRRGPEAPRLRAATLSRDGQLLKLRHLVFHHLDSYGRCVVVWLRAEIRWPDHQLSWLAHRQSLHFMRRGEHGGTRLRLSNGGRALLLGLPPRRTRLGMADGVDEYDWAGHDHGRHQHRSGNLSDRRGHSHLRFAGRVSSARLWKAHELVFPTLRHGPADDSASGAQHLRHSPRRAIERHQRVVAHRRRAAHRGAAHLLGSASQPARFFVFSFERRQSARSFVRKDRWPTGPGAGDGEFSMRSPLFALVPGLIQFYHAAPFALVFVLGLLQAQWTYTGYDASAHVAEETVMARKNSAWGVFLSVAVSAVVGYVLLLILTWCIPKGDVAATANDAYPVLQIVYANLGKFAANLIAVIIGGAMWLCGCSSITSMARMWYAFARDDGMPGSRLIKQVNGRYRTPVWSMVITSGLAIVICLYAAAFYVVTSISTITLYLAYVIPIYLNRRNKRRRQGEYTTPESAPWNLGRWATPINVIAIAWTAFITIIFSLPPNELVLWTMLLVGMLLL